MKISIETNTNDTTATPTLDRLLTRIVAMLEKDTGLKFDVKADGNTVRLAHKAKLLRKTASRVESVIYGADESGYSVITLDANRQAVTEQRGNSGFSFESNLLTAKTAAKNAALDMGIDPRYVAHDPDIYGTRKMAGGQDFASIGKGKSVQEAFDKACEQARYEHGHGGYTGSVAEKHSFVLITPPKGVEPERYAGWVQHVQPDWEEYQDVELKEGQACPKCGKGKIEFREKTYAGKHIGVVPTCSACGANGFNLYSSIKGSGKEEKFFYSKASPIPEQYRNQIARDNQRIQDKWGPAGAIQFGPNEWLFFGTASS
jgi:hypothetical protein